MKRVFMFKGLSRGQKKELKKNYIRYEWKNILVSYIFIVLSSSRPVISSKNGAIFVAAWYSLVILLSVEGYVNQCDYMSRNKKLKKYFKKHKEEKIEKLRNFYPEIGGWHLIGMQMLGASLVYIVALPISLYLQFKNLTIYKDVYVNLFVGILADTYIIAFYNIILQIFIEFIYDCVDNRTTIKKTVMKATLKNVICFVAMIIILVMAFAYYFNNEFAGLFGDISRRVVGIIYILFILLPLFKCIKKTINKNIVFKIFI